MGASIIEIQNGVTVTPIPHYTAEQVQNQTAKSAWYTTCGSACASGVPNHTVVLMADDGKVILCEVFNRTLPSGE